MTSIRPFHAMDIFRFNSTNLDPLTETYDCSFYFNYLARWPHLFNAAEGPDGQIDGYILAKLESSPRQMEFSEHYLPWHGHITALTVSPQARRLGLARTLSTTLEHVGNAYDAWFIDLFVRKSNLIAQSLYRGMGYSVFRTVLDYYTDDPEKPDVRGEDAYDMRKPLKRDKTLKHIRENGEKFEVMPEQVW